jgi:hypothetical protein
MAEADDMELRGRVQNGVVVLEDEASLPEGTMVTVLCPPVPVGSPRTLVHRVALPLVPSDHPGSRTLTADRVAELLQDDDVSA